MRKKIRRNGRRKRKRRGGAETKNSRNRNKHIYQARKERQGDAARKRKVTRKRE